MLPLVYTAAPGRAMPAGLDDCAYHSHIQHKGYVPSYALFWAEVCYIWIMRHGKVESLTYVRALNCPWFYGGMDIDIAAASRRPQALRLLTSAYPDFNISHMAYIGLWSCPATVSEVMVLSSRSVGLFCVRSCAYTICWGWSYWPVKLKVPQPAAG